MAGALSDVVRFRLPAAGGGEVAVPDDFPGRRIVLLFFRGTW